MALTFSGATGALFTRFGHWARIVRELIALKGGTATSTVTASLSTHGTTLETDAAAAPATSQDIDGHWQALDSVRSGLSGGISSLRGLAEKQLIAHVNADTPQLTRDLPTALAEIDRQMKIQSKSLNGSSITIGAQTSLGSPTGTPAFVVTCFRTDGLTYQTPRSETLRFRCSADQYTGNQTARRERITVTGEAAVTTDPFDHRYPSGSGATQTISLCDAAQDGTSGATTGNLLANSDFETASSNTFPGWIYDTGTAGTHFLANGSGYSGDNALKITSNSDTTELTLSQTFETALGSTGNAGGTPTTLQSATLYAVNLWIKAVSAAPASGTLRVALVDGDDLPVADDQGDQALYQEDDTALLQEDDTALYQEAGGNYFVVDLTEISTSFAAYSGVLRTPTVMPTTYKLQLQTSTPITSGNSIVVDDIALTPMTQLYTGGPSVAGFAGATDVKLGDTWTVDIDCTRGLMVDYLERFFALEAKAIILPYHDGEGESEADELISA